MMFFSSVRRHCFTLLELMIVLFIISFGVILTGVKVKGLYREQRFFSEAEQVLNHLRMAQDLMLIMDTDVQVHFAPDRKNDQIQMWLEVEKPLEEKWAHLVERKISLVAIRALEFDDRPREQLMLQFSLGKMSQGKLALFEERNHSQKENGFTIELLGYPSPLGRNKDALKKEEKRVKNERLYPVEVYEKLYKDSHAKKEEE